MSPGSPQSAIFDQAAYEARRVDNNNKEIEIDNDGQISFVGGDQITRLRGQIHHALKTRVDGENTKESPPLPPPVVIMAHGLGLSSDCGLHAFIESFQQAGMSVLTFDYATFGASDGVPRHQVDPSRHVKDLHAVIQVVIDHATALGVDGTRVALWGTSLGGGHVLVTSVTLSSQSDSPVKAVVAQVPALASALESVWGTIRTSPTTGLVGMGKFVLTIVRYGTELILTNGEPWYIPLAGLPGSASLMQNPGDFQGYLSLTPRDGGKYGWKNAVTAMSGMRLLTYRPLSHALSSLSTPTLLLAAVQDTLCPVHYVRQAAAQIPQAELVELADAGHFDVYQGPILEQVLSTTVAFLQQHLGLPIGEVE
eukprot:scaffold5479_cov199-Amphora_coffeaeformis.AAC.35